MEELKDKWKKSIQEYELQEKLNDDQYPAIPWNEENQWKILSRKWIDFSHHFLEEMSGLLQEKKFEEALILVDLMIAKWEELFE
jgi:hypothetical protein